MALAPLEITALSASDDEARLHAALRLVLRNLPADAAAALGLSTVRDARRDAGTLGRLFEARDPQGRILGAVWAQLRPGNVAVVWPPQWTVSPPQTGPDSLLSACVAAVAADGVGLAQSLLPDAECADAQTLVRGGFTHLADLAYLTADVTPVDAAIADVAELQFVPYVAADRERFAQLIESTYEATLDCPALNGIRAAGEVLDEYEAIGAIGTAGWYWVRDAARDVGCLVVADHPAQDQVELVYMALIPSARGRGWGECIARESLRIAATRGRARVVLAVDGANTPAANHYRRAGFHVWEKRAVFVRRLMNLE